MSKDDDPFAVVNRVLDLNLGWVGAADSKIPGLLTVATAMLGVLAALAPSASEWSAFQSTSAAIAAPMLLGVILCLFLALFPRTDGPKSSLVFFEGIASYEREQYVKKVLERPMTELVADIASQCHRNAEIAKQKYGYVQLASKLLFMAILPWLVSVFALYLTRHSK